MTKNAEDHKTKTKRSISFGCMLLLTVLAIFVLDRQWKIRGHHLPALGKFFSPAYGFWQNAEPANYNFSGKIKLPLLKGEVNVYLDDRLVPHVFAQQEIDAYMVQGYLHAMLRLWQMEFETHIAAGRAAEILGERALSHDREFRRLGMVFAAENSLSLMTKDAVIKAELDAYTAGINAFIETLNERTFPIEYKLLGYKPEKWSNIKTVLFLKYMCYDLAGIDDDFEMTTAKIFFSPADLSKLFPVIQDSLDPVIPKGTKFSVQKVFPVAPPDLLKAYLSPGDAVDAEEEKPGRDNGSNNWAVSGKKTSSGAPILCNDPHLQLSLPSVWFEMQLSTPTLNVYGAGFPGLPGIIIGFNDSCSFGFTNGERDVRDYYEIKCKDKSRNEYWFNGNWQKTKWRVEAIRIRDHAAVVDSVAYVQLGTAWCPVMYDETFSGGKNANHKNYAVRWTAHDPSNEIKAFNGLNHARNYADYSAAVSNLHTPGQNCIFASKNGDIAIRSQGAWPAKWKYQGDFIMPGFDSSYLWKEMIPADEIPYQYNPERGFVSSANQKPVDDSTYPYYLGRDYALCRGKLINQKLSSLNNITTADMMAMQADNYNLFAAMARPMLIKNMQLTLLTKEEKEYFDSLQNWNLRNDPGSQAATVFEVYWNSFYKSIFDDEYANAPKRMMHPLDISLLEGILKDTAYKFIDDISTIQKEHLPDAVTVAFKKAVVLLEKLKDEKKIAWEKYKDTHISHFTDLAAFGRMDIPVGGNSNAINVSQSTRGQSWRMVVSLTKQTEAYGIYPGGQSGNPGSKLYDNFIDTWVAGKYYNLWMMTKDEENDKRIKWKIFFSK